MYKILEPIMVRMPLYSHEEYKKIDLFADVDKFIQNFSNRPSFLKAIAISSPDFYTSVKYSLQGTTQGRYLTGGVPPVRFSM